MANKQVGAGATGEYYPIHIYGSKEEFVGPFGFTVSTPAPSVILRA